MDYKQQQQTKITQRLRELLADMPDFLTTFFRGMADIKTIQTRINYGYDLRNFLTFLSEEVTRFNHKPTAEFTLADLEQVTATDIEFFLEHVTLYTKTYTHTKEHDIQRTNEATGKSRKLSAIRSLYNYFMQKEQLKVNPALLIDTPKIKDKNIIRLEVNEVALLLDHVEDGTNLTKKQLEYHRVTRIRDLCLMTLLLGTGMRVSECVGINTEDISLDDNYIMITRKGGNQSVIYFGEEVREVLLAYLKERVDIETKEENDDALFLSMQKRRITERAVQNLVKKYAKGTISTKNISPHKLRSTFGTNLYQETGDIYLVATALGHVDVNTTKKHYASIDEERKRSAAKVVKLRKN